MHKLKASGNGLKERKTGTKWKIVEGLVNRNEDYIKITYGKDPDPIALISRGRVNSFKIQFMLSKVYHRCVFQEVPNGIPVVLKRGLVNQTPLFITAMIKQ